MSSTGRSDALLRHENLPLPVEVRPIRGAKRLRLRLDEKRGILKLTGPLRMNRSKALDWAAEQRAWVEDQVAAMHPPRPLVPGATIPLEGRDVQLVWSKDAPRSARLEPDRLVCGGPPDGFARRVELFLKRHALETLSRETAEFAARIGARVRSVAVGDADTRWGSCSSSGRIRYSWRLILAPPQVRRYVVAHEVAHLRHLDHGPRFRALERELCDCDPDSARRLLRSLGSGLKRIGRPD